MPRGVPMRQGKSKTFSQEFKAEAVRLLEQEGRRRRGVAGSAGGRTWMRRAFVSPTLMSRGRGLRSQGSDAVLHGVASAEGWCFAREGTCARCASSGPEAPPGGRRNPTDPTERSE
jgi:hypothetical protein